MSHAVIPLPVWRHGFIIMIPVSILRHGRPTPLSPLLPLRAGPLRMFFDPNQGRLLEIRLGDHEVLRRIFMAVRDERWDTAPSSVSNLVTEVGQDSFRLTFDVCCRLGPIDYFWRGLAVGESSGRLSFSFEGVSRSSFLRNRLGICVLHPVFECAGKPFTVEHWDGRTESGVFPRAIAPQQPCFDIKSFTHEIVPGVRAELCFEGEVFEMEDQRNFCDVSFKIYSTPQARPKPVAVAPGEATRQSVTLTLHGPARKVLPVVQGRPPQLSIVTTTAVPLPPIGFSTARPRRSLTPREVERLKVLRPAHLRVDVDLTSPSHREDLRQAAAEAEQLGAGLYVALTLSEDTVARLEPVAALVRELAARVCLWIVYHPVESPAGERWVRQAQEKLRACAPGALFAAGTRNFFHELNNNRPGPDATALPCVPANPQVHLTDDATLRENVGGAAGLVESVREFSSKPLVISPFTLRGPFNPGPFAPHVAPEDLPPEVDPRQMSLFGAGWTLASLARLIATGNVHSVTCFETVGWRGLMEAESGSPRPELFPSIPGAVFPLYHLFADLAEFPTRQAHATHSTLPGIVEGLTLVDGSGKRRVLVANLTDEPQEAKIKSGTGRARVRYLDETNAEL
ncbi:MAG TPA: hypothetical protein VNO52_02720, partial [Methylomirabilota bacterium]|nr:hypothetical protein [Methylomirabilota bacterium]